jgi:hypothetical protein
MKNLIKGTMVSVFLFVLFAFAFAVHEIIPSETQLALPGPDAGQLNEYIVRYNPYTSWDLWPNKGRLYRGTEPHGSLLTTFVNDSAYYSIKNKAPMTDGAIIAKENYTADKKFVALTVMAPDGKVLASGKVKGCIQCHSAKKDNDYIFTGKVAK